MKKLLKELLQQLEFESKDYRTESFPSIQDAIKQELEKQEQKPVAYLMDGELFFPYEYYPIAKVGDGAKELFTRPQKREQLNHREIADILEITVDFLEQGGIHTIVSIIRDVEAHHGIGVEVNI